MMEYSVQEKGSQGALITLDGRLDANSAPDLKASLKAAAQRGLIFLVVDLNKVSFIDSSGLSALVSIFKAVREQHGAMALVGVGSQVKVALELTRLDRVFPAYPDAETAFSKIS